PRGAVIKQAAASPHLLRHRGRAVVFTSQDDLERRIDQPDLDVRPDDVLVLQNAGPVGGPGMPEWGNFAMPKKLLDAGVRDMVRISDARMSGTAGGHGRAARVPGGSGRRAAGAGARRRYNRVGCAGANVDCSSGR